ncbi:MAG: hypothetical protein O7E57_10165, partial [Gammaproteobacteria bacterium]|nr:hypothetical protein [Gammaproteobacteria bacterium]
SLLTSDSLSDAQVDAGALEDVWLRLNDLSGSIDASYHRVPVVTIEEIEALFDRESISQLASTLSIVQGDVIELKKLVGEIRDILNIRETTVITGLEKCGFANIKSAQRRLRKLWQAFLNDQRETVIGDLVVEIRMNFDNGERSIEVTESPAAGRGGPELVGDVKRVLTSGIEYDDSGSGCNIRFTDDGANSA